jgi:hypothetical protein
MYEGIFAIALLCAPCKTRQERDLFRAWRENIFRKAGIKNESWQTGQAITVGVVLRPD